MTREISYLYCGGKMWPRLIVSLWTLRKHWDGVVRVYCATQRDADWIRPTCDTLNCEIVLMGRPDTNGSSPRGKCALTSHVVAENAVYIDADTVVEGSLEPMFGYELALTSHGDWTTEGRRVREQLQFYRGVSKWLDELIEIQLGGAYPHINAGTFAFMRDSRMLEKWREIVTEVVRVGAIVPPAPKNTSVVPADTAFQLLTGLYVPTILDDRFNCCCRHGLTWEEPVVRHYCGRRHGRNNREWRWAFLECREINLGGICDHPRRYDMETRNMLIRHEKGGYDPITGYSLGRL